MYHLFAIEANQAIKFLHNGLAISNWFTTFAVLLKKAQMAESVDALVSNTRGCKPMPVRLRLWVQVDTKSPDFRAFCIYNASD